MSTHSPIPISSAGRWVHCPGSCQMQALYPRPSTEDSLNGEAAHNCAARMIMGENIKSGAFADNLQIIDDQMISGGLLYKRDIESVVGPDPLAVDLVIEQKVYAPQISPYLYGTPDCWAVIGETLVIWDYKFGYLPVEVYQNWQGIGYALCILCQHKSVNKVQIRIVQPRASHPNGPIRTWSFPADDAIMYCDRITTAIHAALSPTATVTSGPWCRDCAALLRCDAARKRVSALMEFTETAIPREPDPVTMATELILLRQAKKEIDHRLSAAEALVTSRIRSGELIPGFTVKPSHGRLSWSYDPDVIVALADIQDIDVRKPLELITPTQAKDKGMNINNLAAKKQTGFKLQQVEPVKIFAEK